MIPFLLSLCLPSLAPADDEQLVKSLRTLDANVVPAAERDAMVNQVRDHLRRLLREANEHSSVEWQQIKTREDWERFRSDKLAALKKSLGSWPKPPGLIKP